MKTIKQIADEIGISKQAVYKRFKGKLYAEVYPYIHTKNNVIYILEYGENIIKADFSAYSTISEGAHTEHIRSASMDNTVYTLEQSESVVKANFLDDSTISKGAHTEHIRSAPINTHTDTLIQILQKELEAKNKQIEELTATIKIQAESIGSLQSLVKNAQTLHALEKGGKVNFLKRFFSKRRDS